MKTCCRCKQELSLDSFQKNRVAPDGLQYRCKDCTRTAHKECYAKRGHLWLPAAEQWKNRPENRERRNKTTRERMARLKVENPEKYKEDRRRWQLSAKYDITPELKQALVEIQGSICAICFDPIDAISCATDHSHVGKYVRGMLCKPCNSALGFFKDSPEILRRAAEYLEKSKDIELEPTAEDFEIATNLLQEYLDGESKKPVSL